MSIIKRYTGNSATVCAGKNCVTVYGEAARIITNIALGTVVIIALAAVAKALR